MPGIREEAIRSAGLDRVLAFAVEQLVKLQAIVSGPLINVLQAAVTNGRAGFHPNVT